jgi:fatty acid-binding protein DegV
MTKVKLTVDSGVGTKSCSIIEIPAQILCEQDGNSYLDGVDITNKKIIEDIEAGKYYKTSNPPYECYEQDFRDYLEDNKDVIHLSMSRGISEGSYNMAKLVAEELNQEYEKKVYVIDTLTAATGGIVISDYAEKLIASGLSTHEVITELEEFKTKIKTSFLVPNPEGFIRSGRNKTDINTMDRAKIMFASAAVRGGFKFRVDFNEEGHLFQNGISMGGANKCFKQLVEGTVNESNIEEYDDSIIVLGNLLKDKVNMEVIEEYIQSLKYFKSIIIKDLPGAVAAYGCRDLCGVSLIKKVK